MNMLDRFDFMIWNEGNEFQIHLDYFPVQPDNQDKSSSSSKHFCIFEVLIQSHSAQFPRVLSPVDIS